MASSTEVAAVESEKNQEKQDAVELTSSTVTVTETVKCEVKEDFIGLSTSSEVVIGSENNKVTEGLSSPLRKDVIHEKSFDQGKEDGETEDGQLVETMEIESDFVHKPIFPHEFFRSVATAKGAENDKGARTELVNGNGCVVAEGNHDVDGSPILGVKRARMTYDDQEPSVKVVHKFLTRASKRKLEELLQQWSQWHAQQKFLDNDPNETLESGEQTFFPALNCGPGKAATVMFWMDNQTRKEENEFIPLDSDSVPMYDRGFVLGLSSADDSTNTDGRLETVEASRCFNCGSYSHGMKDCRKPRDHAAVDNARKQHNSKRVQNAGPRNAARYYQNTPGGKYDGIVPGVLGLETRQLLGLGELDPPPWLNRMREMGYPPAYLDPDYEDQPSGIIIYADEKTKDGEDDGEILPTNNPDQKKKMAVEFPGINAPIPENADERRWASLPEASSYDSSRNRPHLNRPSETIGKGNYGDHRRPQDYRDNGPPGCNNLLDLPRYSGYEPNFASDSYGARGYATPPVLGRSLSDRGRWSPHVHNGSPGNNSPYSPVNYGSPNPLQSPQSYNSANPGRSQGSYHNFSSDSSSRRNDRHDHHRHRRM